MYLVCGSGNINTSYDTTINKFTTAVRLTTCTCTPECYCERLHVFARQAGLFFFFPSFLFFLFISSNVNVESYMDDAVDMIW